MVADTLLAADNHPHQAAAGIPPAAGTVPVHPAVPDVLHHVSFHPAVRHTTPPHAISQSDASLQASASSLALSRPAVLPGSRLAYAVRTVGAAAAGRTQLGLGVGHRTGVVPGHRAAAVVVVAGTAAAGSCSLYLVGDRRRGVAAAAGCCCICCRCRTCYRCRIWSLVPERRRMWTSMMNHQGCTLEAVPVLGSCPAGRCQSIHIRSVPAAHATTVVSNHPSNQIEKNSQFRP